MVLSNDNTFELTFIDPFRQCKGKPLEYKHLMTPEGICIIGEVDQHFIINLECKDKDVYGIKVIVDGYILPGRRTFKNKTKIQGFTNSDGNINCFKFQRPKTIEGQENIFKKNVYRPPWDLAQNDNRDYAGGPGEIIVKIYATKQEENQIKPPREGRPPREGGPPPNKSEHPPFVEVCKNETKDILDQSLGIGQGNVIELPPRGGGGGGGPREPRPFKDVVDFDHRVQSFRVTYMDVGTLVQKGFVKLNIHSHISYLNEEFFQGNEQAMIQVLQTLIESGQKDKPENEIQQAVSVIVERLDYYFNGELLNLFMSKENQENFEDYLKQTFIEDQLIKFMDQWPQFFKFLGEKTYAIANKFNLKDYLELVKTQDKEKESILIIQQIENRAIQV